jgi:deoxyribodipyrimidine photo-lyase
MIISSSPPSLAKFTILAPRSTQIFRHYRHSALFSAMQYSNSAKTSAAAEAVELQQVPGLSVQEMHQIAEQTFQRYTSPLLKRKGKGIAIVWFRNDLRILDNEALFKAWVSSEAVLPVYCIDPRLFSTTYYFGFPKTGGIVQHFPL